MQLMLLLGITLAIAAVMFALQNNVPVTVTFALWRLDGSLAMALLLALGLGAIIAGLVSSPAVIKGRWTTPRLRRQIAELEGDKAVLAQRVGELEAELARLSPAPQAESQEPRSYIGLKALIAGGKTEESKQ